MSVRVLVVDDNRANLELMLYLLKAFGYECTPARDGESGLALAKDREFDLALVDVLMPGMDGYEFARRFKAEPSLERVPLVAVTALAMPGDEKRVAAAGFDGYITKPINPERFVGQVERYLRNAANAPMRHAAETEASSRPEPRGPIVLAVDDLQANLDVIRATLTPFGYRVAEARTVREAIALIERALPALIICDLHMPEEGGFALIELVHADDRWRSIPFVFLSSTAWLTKDRRRGLELGARKFILRPIEPERLRREVEELVGRGDDSDR